jgi:hypothetical protein
MVASDRFPVRRLGLAALLIAVAMILLVVLPSPDLSDHRKKSLQGAGVSNAEKFGSQSRARSQSDVVASCLVNRASLPVDVIRRPRDTPIWKLEPALKCRSRKKGRYAPPVPHDQADRNARDHALRLGSS